MKGLQASDRALTRPAIAKSAVGFGPGAASFATVDSENVESAEGGRG